MRFGSLPSWRIFVDAHNQAYELALWFRAAQRINAPAGGAVPGPLDLTPLPRPLATRGSTPQAPDDFVAGWLNWWQALNGRLAWPPAGSGQLVDLAAELRLRSSPPPPHVQFFPPEFPGLARWPALQWVVAQRFQEACAWHNARRVDVPPHTESTQDSATVAEVERELGHPLSDLDLEVILLPVRDTVIRLAAKNRFLVPESVYGTPQWTEWLRTQLLRRSV